MEPTEFIITDTDELIVPNSGLALIGKLLAATKIAKRADSLALPRKPRPEVLHSDVLLAMIGMLCLGNPTSVTLHRFTRIRFSPKHSACAPLRPSRHCASVWSCLKICHSRFCARNPL